MGAAGASGISRETIGRASLEYVLPGQTVDNWKELVTSEVFFKPMPIAVCRQAVRGEGLSRLSVPRFTVIRQDEQTAVVEWRDSGCGGWEPSSELARFAIEKDGVYRLAYSVKGSMKPEKRKEWMGILDKTPLAEGTGRGLTRKERSESQERGGAHGEGGADPRGVRPPERSTMYEPEGRTGETDAGPCRPVQRVVAGVLGGAIRDPRAAERCDDGDTPVGLHSSVMTKAGSGDTMLRVAIIEDRREIRDGLATIINGTPGFRCTGAFRSMEEGLDGIREQVPDIVLSDIGLPGMSGIEGIRRLKERHPDLLVLMLTIYDDDERIFDALCAGASGYLLKNTQPARLLDSLQEAAAGGAPMSPEVARRVIAIFREFRQPASTTCELTRT